MRKIISFGMAIVVAIMAFIVTMLTKPPVSESKSASRIDTYELTLQSTVAPEEDRDCN